MAPRPMFLSRRGPMKGVFPTLDTEPFFPSDTDIQPKINVARHQHSDLAARHLTPHFRPTLTVSFPSRRQTLCKISSRRPTLIPPSWALGRERGSKLSFLLICRPYRHREISKPSPRLWLSLPILTTWARPPPPNNPADGPILPILPTRAASEDPRQDPPS